MKFRSIHKPPIEGKIKYDDALRISRALAKQPVEPKPVRDWTLVVDRSKPKLATKQVRDQLNFLIDKGLVVEGSLLPTERELAQSLKVARNVVRGAYEQLMVAGKIEGTGRAKKGLAVSFSTRKKHASASRSPKSKQLVKGSSSKRTAKSTGSTKSAKAA